MKVFVRSLHFARSDGADDTEPDCELNSFFHGIDRVQKSNLAQWLKGSGFGIAETFDSFSVNHCTRQAASK